MLALPQAKCNRDDTARRLNSRHLKGDDSLSLPIWIRRRRTLLDLSAGCSRQNHFANCTGPNPLDDKPMGDNGAAIHDSPEFAVNMLRSEKFPTIKWPPVREGKTEGTEPARYGKKCEFAPYTVNGRATSYKGDVELTAP